VILAFYDRMNASMNKGTPLAKILNLPIKSEIGRMKELTDLEQIKAIIVKIDESITTLEEEQ
jgi:V/A-type H+-transporting ATPase subunit A